MAPHLLLWLRLVFLGAVPGQDVLEATKEGAVALVAVVNEEEVPAGVPFETQHM